MAWITYEATVLREPLIEPINRLFNRAWLLGLLLTALYLGKHSKSLDITMT